MPDPNFPITFLRSITSKALSDAAEQMKLSDPDIHTLHMLMGNDTFLRWVHTLGVVQREPLRMLAPPVAPFKIRKITASHSESLFLWTGLIDVTSFLEHYHRVAEKRAKVRVLDFGCGGGRMIRYASQSPLYETYGSDVNEDIVQWCSSNLENVTVRKNGALPPLDFESGSMDFLYALSVFSHFPQENHKLWLAEMARVTAPGGIVLLTTHTEHAAGVISKSETHQKMFGLSSQEATAIQGRLANEKYIYINFGASTLSLTKAGDDYGHCFISQQYVKDTWPSYGFDLVDYIPGGMRGFQDIVLLRKQ